MRDLHPDFAAAAVSSTITPATFVFLDILGQPLRLWTGCGIVPYGGHNWQGIGAFGGVDPIEEYSEVRAGQLQLTLTRVPSHTLATLKDLTFKGRAAEVHLGLFTPAEASADDTLIGMELLYRGTMDTLKISRSPKESTITLTIANELQRLRDVWGLLYTDPHQQSLHPGDTSLRFVASLQDLQIRI